MGDDQVEPTSRQARRDRIDGVIGRLAQVLAELLSIQGAGDRDTAGGYVGLAVSDLERARHWLTDAYRNLRDG